MTSKSAHRRQSSAKSSAAAAESPMPSLRETQKQLTRQRVIDTALELFDDRGFGPTTMDDIAKLANLNRGTIYLHFKSKAEVLRAALDDVSDQIVLVEDIDNAATHDELIAVFEKVVILWERRLGQIWRHARDASVVDESIKQWVDDVVSQQVRLTRAVLEHHGVKPAAAHARAVLLICMISEFLGQLNTKDSKLRRKEVVRALADFFSAAARDLGL